MTEHQKPNSENPLRALRLWHRKVLGLLLFICFLPPVMALLVLIVIRLWELASPLILLVLFLLVIAVVRRYLVAQSWRWK